MELTEQARSDMELAETARQAAHQLNMACLAAGNAGLIVVIEVEPQDLEEDGQTETGTVRGVEVTIECE